MTNSSSPKTHYLKDYRVSDFLIDNVHLAFDLAEEQTVVKAVLAMRRNRVANTPDAALVLDGNDMVLQAVIVDGRKLNADEYQVDDHHLTIPNLPEAFVLETEVIIKPQDNLQLSGLYKSSGNFCTQCESHGFQRITYYLDRPDVMSTFTTTITADKNEYPMLLSNGNLIEQKDLDGNRHWVHWEDPSKKPSYLFALVAGDFDLLTDTFTTLSGRNVDLHLYLEKGFKDQGDYALASLKHSMKWDEDAWGREYDLDIYMIVAVSDFNMGAMENKGLNIFNTKYILAKPETATDADYIAIENVIGHEYFHNWSGNRVTCRDWFQLTLKEGLTVFRDQCFIQDMTSPAIVRINEVNVVRNHQFPEDAGPLAHPIRPESYIEMNNFYTSTVYRKGAEVIRMVQTLIGKHTFRKGMDLYFSTFDGQAVTTEDFIAVMEQASQKDLTQFKRWYSQAGTPMLNVSSEYDEKANTFTLNVKQSCPATPGQSKKEPFVLPLSVGLIGKDGNDLLKDGTQVLEITQPEQSFTFDHIAERPIPSLLRGFSAPVKLHYDYSNEELAWLMQCDSDVFACWDADQQLASRLMLSLADDVAHKREMELPDYYLQVIDRIIQDKQRDPNLLARLLAFPTVSYLVDQTDCKNVAALYAAKQFIRQSVAQHLQERLLACYHDNIIDGAYAFNVESVGKRSLKNACLHYLASTNQPQFLDLAYQQFEQANNMTDAMGALRALNHQACEQRDRALADFYEQWKNEPLVVNKWLTMQASSTLPGTLDRVKSLMQHPSFDIRNPNNVYALIVGFGNNIVRLHANGADGYQFIADQVLAIDKHNAQVAGRVIKPLTRWQQMGEPYADLMRQQLQRIVDQKKLSRDIYELANKSLG